MDGGSVSVITGYLESMLSLDSAVKEIVFYAHSKGMDGYYGDTDKDDVIYVTAYKKSSVTKLGVSTLYLYYLERFNNDCFRVIDIKNIKGISIDFDFQNAIFDPDKKAVFV